MKNYLYIFQYFSLYIKLLFCSIFVCKILKKIYVQFLFYLNYLICILFILSFLYKSFCVQSAKTNFAKKMFSPVKVGMLKVKNGYKNLNVPTICNLVRLLLLALETFVSFSTCIHCSN